MNLTNPKEGKIEKIVGAIIVLMVILAVIVIKNGFNGGNAKIETVRVATGGGKEAFMADEEVGKIMRKKYGIEISSDSWSNGKLISAPVIDNKGAKYDAIFFSDERFYDYYKLEPVGSEAKRDRVVDGSLTLNTPIVIYSWDTVTDALMKENIVTERNGIYYISDMEKLLNYILTGKTWKELGLSNIYGKINIDSTDPVSSSPGATYYGLLLSIMTGGDLSTSKVNEVLPKLKEFYQKSGYMNNTPADLFEMYLKTGVGAKPMIVDYEKSIIEFATSNPNGWNQVKDKIRILYPTPTIWNSHCIATFNDTGNKFLNAFEDANIQQIAWSKYGFRVGVSGGNYDVSAVDINGIPQTIDMVTGGLKMDIYNKIIDYLK